MDQINTLAGLCGKTLLGSLIHCPITSSTQTLVVEIWPDAGRWGNLLRGVPSYIATCSCYAALFTRGTKEVRKYVILPHKGCV
jgi:hypothetical protein